MKKIIIIGAGIAGLSAGVYGKLAGYDVEIYEKNPVAGGECMGWNRNGYHIDNCIHWLTGSKAGTELRKVWETVGALDANTKFAPTEKFYTSYCKGGKATLWKDLGKTERELLALAPEDTAEIKKFIQHVRYAQSCVIPSKKPMDMMGVLDYIEMGKDMADMPKVMKEYGNINLEDLAARFSNPVIKALFTDYLPKEYIAYSFLVSYATIVCGNGDIPQGGSLAMAERMAERFCSLGGRLYCNQPVKRILTERKKAVGIELSEGRQLFADYIISAVDTRELYTRLIGERYMNEEWRRAYADMDKYPVTSGFQAAFAIDRECFAQTDTIFFDCEPFFLGERKIDRMSVKSYAYEPGFAPEGKAVLQMNITQTDRDYLYWKGLSQENYRAVKEKTAALATERILAQFPQLTGHIILLDCWTPLTYERYCNAYHGAYMSFVTTKGTKPFRDKGVIKGLEHFYIASQWMNNPGGLPIAVTSGKFAIQRILKKEKRPYLLEE